MKLRYFKSHPSRTILLAWSLYHLLVWTVLPLACNSCLPLDSMEAVLWGSQWQWGYDKHPPLSAWAAELFSLLLGDGGIYLLSQLCIVGAGLGVYKLGRQLNISPLQSAVAVLLLDTLYFYQYISVEFNVNILQYPLWAWGWYFGIRAGKERRHWGLWLGLGACVGLGALAKYLAVLLLIPLFAAWWRRGELGRVLRSPGLWFAGAVSILIFMPHLLWMANNEWITITYALERGGEAPLTWASHIWEPIEFALSQLGILLPLLILLGCMARRREANRSAPAGTFALWTGAYAAILVLCLATGMSAVTMWAAPMPLAIGLWAVPRFGLDRHLKPVAITVVSLSLVFVLAYAIVYGLGPRIREKPHRVNYPARTIAEQVETRWHESYDKPLRYVVAHQWLGGMINRYGEDRPAVMINANPARSSDLSVEQIKQTGAVVLWRKSYDHTESSNRALETVLPKLKDNFHDFRPQPDMVIPWPGRTDGRKGRYGIAFIPPKTAGTPSAP